MPTDSRLHEFMVRAGESLKVGERIVSKDSRFHLYLEKDGRSKGHLQAYSYHNSQGIKRYWQSAPSIFPGVSLSIEQEFRGYPARPFPNPFPAVVLRDKDGNITWWQGNLGFMHSRGWRGLYLAVQVDGNIVFRVGQGGQHRTVWASDTTGGWIRKKAIPPNITVCKVEGPGQLHINTSPEHNAEIVNKTSELILAIDKSKSLSIPPGDRIGGTFPPGTISISTSQKIWPDLRASEGTKHSDEKQDAVRFSANANGTGIKTIVAVTDGARLRLSGTDEFDGETVEMSDQAAMQEERIGLEIQEDKCE